MSREANRRSGLAVMGGLVGLVAPLLPVMVAAILLGAIGHLCAIFLTIVAACVLVYWIEASGIISLNSDGLASSLTGDLSDGNWLADIYLQLPHSWWWILIVLACLRGVFHYGEQYCNHFIAFKLLALIRHKVFAKLRTLAPAKLESRRKGDLVAVITQDIELLEVFYAHTISPIAIAIITSAVMVGLIAQFSVSAACVAVLAYLVVGAVIPLYFGKHGAKPGVEYRNQVSALNSFLLDSMWGLDEILQYRQGEKRRENLNAKSREISVPMRGLNAVEANQKAVTNLALLGFSFAVLFLLIWQYQSGLVTGLGLILGTVAMMSSFGPVIALASLSNSLHQTLACGERVLQVLEETPQILDITGKPETSFAGAALEQVDFAYTAAAVPASASSNTAATASTTSTDLVLRNFSLDIPVHQVVGLCGPSGCGKSTALKLLLRFWDPLFGRVQISGTDVREINTDNLRSMEAFVSQETMLFHGTIGENIAVGKLGATPAEIEEAARKASIHDFIASLPDGYDTLLGEGISLSGGETQRIGMARAFLHDGPFMLLDEPTSNLDSLNEGIILKALREERGEKTVLLVSHRQSTMSVVDTTVMLTATSQKAS